MPDVWARQVRRFLFTASGDKALGIGSRVVVEPPAVGVLTIKPKNCPDRDDNGAELRSPGHHGRPDANGADGLNDQARPAMIGIGNAWPRCRGDYGLNQPSPDGDTQGLFDHLRGLRALP